MTVRAPAKLNLVLRVLGPGADGFHDIETLFLRLDLADELEIRSGGEGVRLSVRDAPAGSGRDAVPTDARNLCWRAAESFFAAIGAPPAAGIRLTKRIPVAAGLGGGSSDAAAVLRELNRLAGGPLDAGRLLALAAGLGSDVPFFASGAAAAIGRGRGEQLTVLRPPSPRPVLLVVPTFGVAAADAYRWWSEDPGAAGPGAAAAGMRPVALPDPAGAADWDVLVGIAGNDLAGPVGRRHPELEAAASDLRASGADIALLCGSGSCVAGVFSDEDARAAAAGRWVDPAPPFTGWKAIATRTVADPG